MRYDPEHKQQTRAKVLKEAAKMIRTSGPEGVAVAGVMAKAGLTHGGFYAHFASRDDLVAAAVDRMFEDSRAQLPRASADKSPAALVSTYIDRYLAPAHRDTRSAGCPLPFLSADMPRIGGAARERFAAGAAEIRTALADLLGRLGSAEPEQAASSMLAELVGALALARAEPDPARSDAILAHSRAALKRRFSLESPI
jgi:TetR/AcrR family transcriptional repressor of nem operon